MASSPLGPMSIGELAQRTGVPPATLRSWEARFGFPRPVRLAGGHRRYAEEDVSRVLEVLRRKESGFALEAAVRLAAAEPRGPRSVYAELRRRYAELTPQLLSKSSLVALSHAIEDECCARAETPVLFGAFQRNTFLRESYARWVELARTARATVVFADLTDPAAPTPAMPIEVAIPHEAPLNREWIVVCDAPDLPACLAAVERPGQPPGPASSRRFETVWTVDPSAVRHASRVAAALADAYRPEWRIVDLDDMGDEPPAASADLRRASALLHRTMGYLDPRR